MGLQKLFFSCSSEQTKKETISHILPAGFQNSRCRKMQVENDMGKEILNQLIAGTTPDDKTAIKKRGQKKTAWTKQFYSAAAPSRRTACWRRIFGSIKELKAYKGSMQTHELYQGYYNKLATRLRISEKDQQRMDNLWETLCKARKYLVRHSRGQGPYERSTINIYKKPTSK